MKVLALTWFIWFGFLALVKAIEYLIQYLTKENVDPELIHSLMDVLMLPSCGLAFALTML